MIARQFARPHQKLADEGVVEGPAAAECLRHRVGALGDCAAHPHRADVREVPLTAVEGRTAEVDRGRRAREREPHRVVEACRNAVRAPEVLPRPGRQDRELDAGAGDAVDDFVQSSVAADDDEQIVLRRGGARELGQLPGPFGEQNLAPQSERGRPFVQLRPALAGFSVSAGRIDEEDGANGRRSLRPKRASSSGRPMPSARRR